MITALLVFSCTFGSFFGNLLAQWFIGRSKLSEHNRRLMAWIDLQQAQQRQPALGPHRTAPLGIGHMLQDNVGEMHTCRREPPPPTAVPSPGRIVEE